MRTILLIMIGLSSFLSANFIKNGNVVTDRTTGLEWQDNSDNNSTQKTWQEVIDYCEALTLDTYNDWRLPNIKELKSIVDRSKRDPAIVDSFKYVKSSYYWSSSSIAGVEFYGWIVDFYDGSDVDGKGKYNTYYVRCVRDGQ